MSTVTAIYENGVFRPLEKVDLPEGAIVVITWDDLPLQPGDNARESAKDTCET